VIDLVPTGESAEAAHTRASKRAWLKERDYRICEVSAGDVEAAVAGVLDQLARRLGL
jgi:tRNA/rRNA methyltransferase